MEGEALVERNRKEIKQAQHGENRHKDSVVYGRRIACESIRDDVPCNCHDK